jgi:hypothetical protein
LTNEICILTASQTHTTFTHTMRTTQVQFQCIGARSFSLTSKFLQWQRQRCEKINNNQQQRDKKSPYRFSLTVQSSLLNPHMMLAMTTCFGKSAFNSVTALHQ